MGLNRITINNITVEVEGNDVSVRKGVIYVDEVPIATRLSGEVHVIWEGDLATIEADGSVTCHDVAGNVFAGGSIQCRDVEGHINAKGSVHATGVAAGTGAGVRIGRGEINSVRGDAAKRVGHGHINAGGSVHVRGRSGGHGHINAGGSVHLDN